MKKSELKQLIKEELIKKGLLQEEISLDDTFNNLDQYIYSNYESIKHNMDVYGWDLEDIKGLRNYYDVAHLLDVDTRLLKDSDLKYITKSIVSILSDIEGVNEMSTTGTGAGFSAGQGEQYATPFAFSKNIEKNKATKFAEKLGYKTVKSKKRPYHTKAFDYLEETK